MRENRTGLVKNLILGYLCVAECGAYDNELVVFCV